MEGNADIFVSSAEADRPWVGLLVRALRAEGWSVYWDLDLPTREGFEQPPVEPALEASKLVIVVLSRRSVEARGVQRTVSWLESEGTALAVLRDEVTVPHQLEDCPTVSMRAWEGGRLPEQLRREIGWRLDRASAPPPPPGPHVAPPTADPSPFEATQASPPSRSVRRSSPFLMTVMATLVLGGLGGVWYQYSIVGNSLPYPSAPIDMKPWQPTADSIAIVQAALGVRPTGVLGAQGSTTRDAIAEFQRGLRARGEDWDVTGELGADTADLLLGLRPMPETLASSFERAFLTSKEPGGPFMARYYAVDRARIEMLWRAVGLSGEPPPGDAAWPALRPAISAARARAGLDPGHALDSRLWDVIRPR